MFGLVILVAVGDRGWWFTVEVYLLLYGILHTNSKLLYLVIGGGGLMGGDGGTIMREGRRKRKGKGKGASISQIIGSRYYAVPDKEARYLCV